MANKTTSPETESSIFIQQHSAQLRIWHWLTFLFLTGSIVTVLLNSTLLSQSDNVKLVQEQLEKKGLSATDEQAFAVSHEYEEKMWEVHKLIGYGLALLLLARIVIEFTQPEEEKMRNRLKKAVELSKSGEPNSAEYSHYIRVKRAYMIFFILLFLMVITGLAMAFGRDLGLTREIRGGLKNVHGVIQYFMYAFVLIHLAGVILAENGKMRGIVSGMIHGNKS